MQSDNDYSATVADQKLAVNEDQQEKTLQWLLEQDYSEPSENLFAVSQDEQIESGLTAYETEVANRPMFGGEASADDLSSLVGEEIVMTVPGQNTEIFSSADASGQSASIHNDGAGMTIDHSMAQSRMSDNSEGLVEEGSDILGLAEEDDIGEHFLVLQKSNQANASAQAESGKAIPAPVLGPVDDQDAATNLDESPLETPELSMLIEDSLEMEAAEESTASAHEIDDEIVSDTFLSSVAPETEFLESFEDLTIEVDTEELTEGVLDPEVPQFLSAPVEQVIAGPEDPLLDLPVFEGDLSSGTFLSSFGASEEVLEEGLETTSEAIEDIALASESLEIQELEETDAIERELSMSSDDIVDTLSVNAAQEYDVYDYVAANEPPVDDEDFDEYLLRGGHFENIDTDVDTLVVDRTEGVASVDPKMDSVIDYHQDFQVESGLGDTAVANITGIIAELMNEISSNVAVRLSELSLEHVSLDVDFMLASDAESMAQCVSDDFQPVMEMMSDRPVALSRLGQSEIDAIYLRISRDGECEGWSELFTEGFICPLDAPGQDGSSLSEHAASSAPSLEIVSVPPAAGIFGEDIFSADISDDLDTLAVDFEQSDFELSADALDMEAELPAQATENSGNTIFDEDIFSAASLDDLSFNGDAGDEGLEAAFEGIAEETLAEEGLETLVNYENSEVLETAEEPDALELLEAVEDTEEVEALDSLEALEEAEAIEVAEPVEAVEDTEEVEALDSLEALEEAEAIEVAEPVEAVEETAEVEALDSLEALEEAEAIEVAEPVEAVEDTEEVEALDSLEALEEAEAIEVAEPVEAVEETAEVEALDSLEVLEEAEAIEFAELVEAVEEFGAAETIEAVDAAEGLNDLEAIEDIASVFEDDIFGDDFTAELSSPEQDGSGEDVDALFASLVDVETVDDALCEAALEEFAVNEVEDYTPPVIEVPTAVEVPEPIAASTKSDLSWCVPADIKFSYSGESTGEVFADFLDAFIEEGATELEKLEDAVGEWERDINSEVAYAPVPRILHTLKGIAKGVGLQRYGTFIHNFETLLEALARPEAGREAAYFSIVNAWLDNAVRGFEHIESSRGDVESELPSVGGAPLESQPVVGEAAAQQAVIQDSAVETAAAGTSTEDVSSTDSATPVTSTSVAIEEQKKDKQLADEGAKVLTAQQTIRMTPEALDRLMSLTNEAQQLGVRSSQSTVRSKRAATELLHRLSSVRAHVSKIAEKALLKVTAKGGQASSEMDALEMDQYSELQEAANILREGVEDLDDLIHLSNRQNAAAEALLKQQASSLSSLSSSIQAARVIPVSRMMPGLRRMVRTVSADLGKSVFFRVINEFGSLDRDNHARCQTIMEHMVRNALDHGIEKPEDRVAAGKDATGRITIDASKQGSDYILTLTDDGKGIDPEFMRDMAYEKGLDVDVDALSDDEAIRLIFHKGFSTANKVSEISGRGVGMDIVLSELQNIGGDIDIESAVGEGTTFRVRIPSNVTVNGALLVSAGDVSYAIPLDGLIAVEHVPVADFYEALSEGGTLSLFGMECEPGYLATICTGDSMPESSTWGSTVPVIIAGSDSRYMAIAIDDVAQALELVIRALGSQFSNIPGLAGGATTADGQSVVALNLNELVASVASNEQSTISHQKQREERMLILVVDDSRTQRMVATSQFDTLGVETITAENGLVAIDMLNTTHRLPDVILLDIEMPVKDGIQTLREIRKSDRYNHLPVIMVTSRTGAKHRTLAEEAGCNGYMGKPFNFPKLVAQIADLTDHKFQLS